MITPDVKASRPSSYYALVKAISESNVTLSYSLRFPFGYIQMMMPSSEHQYRVILPFLDLSNPLLTPQSDPSEHSPQLSPKNHKINILISISLKFFKPPTIGFLLKMDPSGIKPQKSQNVDQSAATVAKAFAQHASVRPQQGQADPKVLDISLKISPNEKSRESLALALSLPKMTEKKDALPNTPFKAVVIPPHYSAPVTNHNQLAVLLIPHPNHPLQFPLTAVLPFPFEHKITSSSSIKAEKRPSKTSKRKGAKEKEEESQSMALIPQGLLIGVFNDSQEKEIEAFAIATTPVTNIQYCHWLNDLFEASQLTLNGGEILDLQGNLLCLTVEKAPTSQIQMTFSEGLFLFKPLKHRDHHPVVHVSYLGALSFCEGQGFRLPTESEWERAAAMSLPHPDQPLKKFVYGCGSDEMNPSFANYREGFSIDKFLENRTTPVGFYNGESVFAKLYTTLQTKLAISPFGCYDMSGNVREWVSEEGVVKGGSYNCPLEDLKITSRVLNGQTADAFTGFRVATNL